jgi:hypothetical protein
MPGLRSVLDTVAVTLTDLPASTDPIAGFNVSHACCFDARQVSVPPPELLIVSIFWVSDDPKLNASGEKANPGIATFTGMFPLPPLDVRAMVSV